MGIDAGTVQHEAVNADFLLSEVIDGVDHQHDLLEGKQRVRALPQGVTQAL